MNFLMLEHFLVMVTGRILGSFLDQPLTGTGMGLVVAGEN
jgi:hypothetical protein